MSKGLEAFKDIIKIYGETNSLEGTYDLFLKIKKELKALEIIKKHKATMNCYDGVKLLYSDYCICISHDDKDYQLLNEVLEE